MPKLYAEVYIVTSLSSIQIMASGISASFQPQTIKAHAENEKEVHA